MIKNKTKSRFLPARRLTAITKKTLSYLLRSEGYEDAAVSIMFIDDSEIAELNKTYMGKNRPTDVLSFTMIDDESDDESGIPLMLGDIVISVETALRQSQEYEQSLEDEITLLLIHGFLHLLGYEDTDKIRKKKMDERTLFHINELKRK